MKQICRYKSYSSGFDAMVTHVLKDGTTIASVENIVINADDFPMIYAIVASIKKEGETD